MKKLTIKQQKFADEYIISGNATEAYKKAGYKYSSDNMASVEGHKLLRNPKVKSYIEEQMKELEAETIADQTEVLQFLTSILRDEMTEEVLVNVGNFEQSIQDKKISARDKIKAAELLGKRYGSWTDKVNLEGNLPVIIYGEDEIED